jgi:A/G-specific adenine glycosylase
VDSAALSRSLLGWYRRNARDLPWRETDDPYAIWVSEVMLQQTQVVTVEPFFARFIERFPTLDSLRRADPQDVLTAWQGLGYYRRARNLHSAARQMQSLPSDFDGLRALPGIGDYTASAIAAIAFGKKHAAIDGNAERVLSRLFCLEGTGAELRKQCKSISLELMGRANPGTWNQAVMELGATVCRPFDPDCKRCPISKFCRAHQKNSVHLFPCAKPRAKQVHVHHLCVCPVKQNRLGLRVIPEGRWWSGLWEFPRIELHPGESQAHAIERLGFRDAARLTKIRHTVTHHSITLHAYISPKGAGNGVLRWVPSNRLDSLPLPSPQRRIAEIAKQTVLSWE